MKVRNQPFDEHATLLALRHFLPAQAISGDFFHRNILRAFQPYPFHDALRFAARMLGYKTTLPLEEYRSFYNSRKVDPEILERVLLEKKGPDLAHEWRDKVLMKKFPRADAPRIGQLRANWQTQFRMDLNAAVHPTLFRFLGSYLDRGVASWKFPVSGQGFLASLREIEANSFASIFGKSRAKNLLLNAHPSITDLLAIVVGDETRYEQYLFDQQFAHRGWSGLVASIGQSGPPAGSRGITLEDVVIFELLLEIDALDRRFKGNWPPLAARLVNPPQSLFAEVPATDLDDVLAIWQEALEWSYYDQVLAGIQGGTTAGNMTGREGFQALCVVGGPSLMRSVPTDGRAFLCPYEHSMDTDGVLLSNVLKARIPACAANNLEYFFARMDDEQPAKASWLSHFVNGFLGISSGIDSDLTQELPPAMAAGHDPLRMLFIVEDFPETLLEVLRNLGTPYDLVKNEWVRLVAITPGTNELFVFKNGRMVPYKSELKILAIGSW